MSTQWPGRGPRMSSRAQGGLQPPQAESVLLGGLTWADLPARAVTELTGGSLLHGDARSISGRFCVPGDGAVHWTEAVRLPSTAGSLLSSLSLSFAAISLPGPSLPVAVFL